MDAFILAAGRGERLRPLTDSVPKPLVEIGGRSLIEHHLDSLSTAGIRRVIINLSWLGKMIREKIGNGDRFGLEIIYSDEGPQALETAGGIHHALPLLKSSEFLLVNGDILTDFSFTSLQIPDNCEACLVMTRNPPHHPEGDFALQGHRLIAARPGHSTYTYSGIGRYKKSLFEGQSGGYKRLRPLLDQLIANNQLAGVLHHGNWYDIGSHEQLATARNAFPFHSKQNQDELSRNTGRNQ